MVFLRFLLLIVLAQTIIYLSLMLYFRAGEKERLEADYPETASDREREAFVDRSLDSYTRRLRPRLAMLVSGLPFLALAGYIYWSNFG